MLQTANGSGGSCEEPFTTFFGFGFVNTLNRFLQLWSLLGMKLNEGKNVNP